MAYTNFTNCTANEYKNIIYNQETKNKIKILFNNVELEDADEYCELFEVQSRVIPYGSKVFTLENLVSQEATLILHNIDTSIIQDQVSISIGTLVDSQNDIYEYVPIGIYNLQEIPTTDKGKTTILLRDNSVKLDFYYNAQPLIELNGGTATKLQILQDICYQAGITCNVLSFPGDSDEIGIYDNTIKGRQYVSWLAGSAGAIPIITRNGALDFKYINNLSTIEIPIEKVEGFTNAENFKISKVIYESGIIKYEQGNETNDTLFLDSANPYVLSQEQVEDIYDIVNGFEINSFTTQRILGNPSIDAYDLIQITDYDETVYKCFANNILRYTGKLLNTFDSEISFERKKENVTLGKSLTFQKWAKTEIDSANAKILLQAGEIGDRTNKQTSLTQDVDGLISEVQNIPVVTTENSGIGQIQLQDLAGVKVAGFRVHPTNQDILGLLASNSLIASNDLIVRNREIVFKKGNFKAQFDLPPLYYYNSDIYDEFVYDTVEERAYKIQRVSVDSQGNKSILSTPIVIDFEYKDIQLEEGNYNIYVSTCSTAYIYAKGMIKNEYTETFATRAELNSKIEQEANRINAEVSQKVDDSEVIAKLNLAIEKGQGVIYAKSNSLVVDSDNFKLDEQGNMNVGGYITSQRGIITNLQYVAGGISNYGGFYIFGYLWDGNTPITFEYADLFILGYIPNNFEVVSANVVVSHSTIQQTDFNNNDYYGYAHDIKVYKAPPNRVNANAIYGGMEASYIAIPNEELGTPIAIIGDPATTTELGKKDVMIAQIDASNFPSGDFLIVVRARDSYNSYPTDYSQACQRTGIGHAVLNIMGYMKVDEPMQTRRVVVENNEQQIETQEEQQRGISEEEPLNIGEPNEEEESDR